MDFELSLLPVAATTVAGLACYVIYRRLVGSKPTNDATAAAVAAGDVVVVRRDLDLLRLPSDGVLGVLVYGAHWDCFGGKGASKGVRGTTRLCGFRDAINAAFQLQRKA